MSTKRTLGITVLSLFLGLKSLNGFVYFYEIMANPNYSMLAISYVDLVVLVGGIIALITCVGLWKMKPWAYNSFLLWCAAVIAFSFIFQFYIFGMLLWQFALYILFIGTILFAIARYVRRVLRVSH